MKIPILLANNDAAFTEQLIAAFQQRHPEVDVLLPGQPGSDKVQVAACWFPDNTLLTNYPNIKFIHALSAGVDHLGESLLSSGLPICRIVDERQKQGMFEYVLWGVLNVHRYFDLAAQNQRQNRWQRYKQKAAQDIRVSVLGLGALGEYVAKGLADLGYSVSGWSRSQKAMANITCYSGEASLSDMLGQTDILINLLPLSPVTKGILSRKLFDLLPQGAYVINCGRGGHVNEADLIQAVTRGHLRGAMLDVFDEEPLPETNPLWTTQGIVITPHMASDAGETVVVDQVAENAARFLRGDALLNPVNLDHGY